MIALPDGILGNVLSHLKAVEPKRDGSFMARCPAHDDGRPSLHVSMGRDGRVVLNCFAKCPTESIVASAGLSMQDLFPQSSKSTKVRTDDAPYKRSGGVMVKSYDYTDENGRLLYQVCRYEPKDFRQRRPDGKGNWIDSIKGVTPVLYNLPRVIEAVAEERTVYLVEGEKDADTLNELGYVATTWAMGSSAWKDEYAKWLRGASVTALPDNDEPGRAVMQQAAAAITNLRGRVKVVHLPRQAEKADVTDWLDAGNSLDELAELEGTTPIWQLDPSKRSRFTLRELWENDAIMRPPPVVVPYLAWQSRSTLLAAAEKSGKSTMAGYVAAQVTNGGDFMGARCTEGTVLIVGLEEFIGEVAQRLKRFGANPDRLEVVDRFFSDPTVKDRTAEVRGHIEAVGPSLTIVDTLMAYAEGIVDDAVKSSQMQPVVQSLSRLAHETATGLIITHHARRSDGKYRDSSAIGGGVDVIVEVFVPDENTDPTLRRARARGRVPTHGFDFRLDGDTYRLALGQEAPVELQIVEYVRDHPGTSSNDVAEHIQGNRQKTLRTITALIAGKHLLEQSEGRGRRLFVPASVTGSFLS